MNLRPALLPALAVALVAACAEPRETNPAGGVHPAGFAKEASADFHGTYLKNNLYPLSECRICHGDDYGGGAVDVSCNQANCHSQGVESCGTCHDGKTPPQPVTGGHTAHTQPCSDCHSVPTDARGGAHPNGKTAVLLAGLGVKDSPSAEWSPTERRCSDTYCHGAESPVWEPVPGPLECDSCHEAPPEALHARFSVGVTPTGCAPCHGDADGPNHLDGDIDFVEPSCIQCHGSVTIGAPPPALDGSTSPTSPAVGAHLRHLDETLADRMGRTLQCVECHEIPATMRAEGHLDDAAPADVRLFDGAYSPETGTCVVGCHWDKDPGPEWTDASGAARECGACHGFPPVLTRTGAPHPAVEPSQAVCQACHNFEVSTHVDGNVDFLP